MVRSTDAGTAITVAAAMVSALGVTGKKIEEIRRVASETGAAALAKLPLRSHTMLTR